MSLNYDVFAASICWQLQTTSGRERSDKNILREFPDNSENGANGPA